MRNNTRLAIGFLMAVALVFPSLGFAQAKMRPSQAPTRTELQLALRSLWVDHIFWVRNVVLMTKLGDADAAKVAEEQTVQNAKDLAASISPYYGKEASDKLFTLLAGHYTSIKGYMTAVFSGNESAKTAAEDAMKKNAEEIASFLSSANPKHWPKEALLTALLTHGAEHMAQIEDINKKDYTAGAKVWEAERAQIYTIADVLAQGIAKQFNLKS